MSHKIFLCSYYFSTLEAGLMEKCHVCPSRHKTVVKNTSTDVQNNNSYVADPQEGTKLFRTTQLIK